ncbi:hypothetical protein BKA70DRAFT_1433610 [Coprinopsis sp. MPI-PUGE-AT-0042]|nr:hypothetical protein BKA70DRAFT_1433610 [Coprinopsis sp. MPI-PUGE-AT-0042]
MHPLMRQPNNLQQSIFPSTASGTSALNAAHLAPTISASANENSHNHPDHPPASSDANTDEMSNIELAGDNTGGVDYSGEGIGEEDGGEDEGDERDDEGAIDGDEEDEVGKSGPRARARLAQPNWLLTLFAAIIKSMNEKDTNGVPVLYSCNQTFWVEPPAAWFLLNNGGPISPQRIFQPQFFVWDPQAVFKNLSCPSCKNTLHRHSAMSRPRWVVDISNSFWLIGYRYRCRHCQHPRTGKKTVTWRSWDPKILSVLPPALAEEFPACMTYRRAIS